MTYCVAIAVDKGLVFASDSRTNAGVDHISVYPKMNTFEIPGRAYFVLCSAGNLATSQAVIKSIQRDLDHEAAESLATCRDMSDAARYIGTLSVRHRLYYQKELEQKATFDASFLLGGQVVGEAPDLMMIYPEGNYITYSPYSPYMQLGETKYGKPILDRVIKCATSLEDAAKCALVSLDSTMRSNLSVAPPIDLLILEKDAFQPAQRWQLKLNSPYYASLRKRWGEGLLELFDNLPAFDWEKE